MKDQVRLVDLWATKVTKLIQNNLHPCSYVFSIVKGVGPRYCPSIEIKIVRFADKERHLSFLRASEGRDVKEVMQGLSNSLPKMYKVTLGSISLSRV